MWTHALKGFLYLLDSIYGTFEILLDHSQISYLLFHFVMCCLLTIPELLVILTWYAWIKDWSTYHQMWSIFWYVTLVQLWRWTQYIEDAECRKGYIDYLQVRECIQCMNEYQGRNNGWAEMTKLMLYLGACIAQHTHTHTHEAQYSWIRPKTTFGQKRQPYTYQRTLTKLRPDLATKPHHSLVPRLSLVSVQFTP